MCDLLFRLFSWLYPSHQTFLTFFELKCNRPTRISLFSQFINWFAGRMLLQWNCSNGLTCQWTQTRWKQFYTWPTETILWAIVCSSFCFFCPFIWKCMGAQWTSTIRDKLYNLLINELYFNPECSFTFVELHVTERINEKREKDLEY